MLVLDAPLVAGRAIIPTHRRRSPPLGPRRVATLAA